MVPKGLKSNESILKHSSAPNPFVPPTPNLSLSIHLLLVKSHSTFISVLIRGWGVLFVSVQWLIRSFARGASELHPEENNRLADQHSDGRGSHTESDTDQDGYEDDSEGGPEDRDHTVSDTIVVVMVAVTERLEVDMGGELHGTI